MITYNGFKPGESRVTKQRPRKQDGGHTIVSMTTSWSGGAFIFHYLAVCECGAKFGTRTGDMSGLVSRIVRHHEKVAS